MFATCGLKDRNLFFTAWCSANRSCVERIPCSVRAGFRAESQGLLSTVRDAFPASPAPRDATCACIMSLIGRGTGMVGSAKQPRL